MAKMWAGRTSGITDSVADDFNSSVHFDCRMYKEDITGSMAHAAMLAAQNIISKEDSEKLIDGLSGILEDIESNYKQHKESGHNISHIHSHLLLLLITPVMFLDTYNVDTC